MSEKRRHRSSLDYGYTPYGRNRKSFENRLHRRAFSDLGTSRDFSDSDDETVGKTVKRRRVLPHPTFNGYQLVGDSLLLRFAEQVLFERCIYDNGLRYLGLCVSGQTIEELLSRVETGFSPVGEKIILLIGTNNILQNSSAVSMKQNLVKLLDVLGATAKRIVILTLPPIPKLENKEYFWFTFNQYNSFLKSLGAKRENLHVENISKLFLDDDLNCNMDYFERWYDKLQRRPDMIHLNRAGFLKIKTHLCKNKVLVEEKESSDED